MKELASSPSNSTGGIRELREIARQLTRIADALDAPEVGATVRKAALFRRTPEGDVPVKLATEQGVWTTTWPRLNEATDEQLTAEAVRRGLWTFGP